MPSSIIKGPLASKMASTRLEQNKTENKRVEILRITVHIISVQCKNVFKMCLKSYNLENTFIEICW